MTQYTVRHIPPSLDEAIRRRAQERQESINTVVLRGLMRGFDLRPGAGKRRSLGRIAGTWQEDPEFDAAIEEQQQIDESLWE